MKTNVVEFGTVIEEKGPVARVVLDKGTSCRKCGMAALGLCKPGGSGLVVEVENPLRAKVGDRVKLGLKRQTHMKGYLLAFVLPLAGFIIASFAGYILSVISGVSSLEVPTGLLGLTVSVFFGLKALRRMDQKERLHIEKIISLTPSEALEGPSNPEGRDYLHRFTF